MFSNKKKIRFTAGICRLSVIIAILLIAVYAYPAQISFMAGDVKIIRGGKIQKAAFQMKLNPGDILKTGKGAFADVSYDDGSVIKVRENTSVTIGNKNEKNSDALSVTSGIISAKFAKLEKESARKVYTPTTVCAIRGTEFDVAVSDSADSKVKMLEGELALLNPYGDITVSQNQNAEIGVAKSPAEAPGGDLETWKAETDDNLDNNPEEKTDAFSQYVKDFQQRNESTSKNITDLQKNQGTAIKGGQEKLKEAGKEIESVENSVKDDMYLNAAANNSIDGILVRFKQDKKNIYDNFLRIKKESNKVLEQQKKNFAAISAVKEAYKKAYDNIMKKHQTEMEKIKGGFKKEDVLPKK